MESTAPSGEEAGGRAIHVYIGEAGRRRRVDFAPASVEIAGDAAAPGPSPSRSVLAGPGLRTQANVETPDGGVEIDQTQLSSESGWYLLAGAAAECGVYPSGGAFNSHNPVIPPWSDEGVSWFIFRGLSSAPADSCDTLLAWQQSLLCTADKLTQVADAVAPLRWEKTASLTIPGIAGPWLIPVQSSQDRFIARELAIHVLAHLAWLDIIRVGASLPFTTCAQGYADAIENPGAWVSGDKTPLFKAYSSAGSVSNYAFPPTPVTGSFWSTTTVESWAKNRLSFKTQILRHASRLLERLVTTSVQEDVGTAARLRAQAGDPARGLQAMWGTADGPKWNSLSHALRVAFGRWEMGSPSYGHSDPHCEGLFTNEDPWLFGEGTYGPDIVARSEDSPVTTPGQRRAIEWVHASGLIPPRDAINSSGDTARGYLTDQIIFREAVRHGLAAPADLSQFISSGQGAALKSSLDSIPDGDLRFALHHVRRQHMALTGTGDGQTSTDVASIAALKADGAHVSTSVPSNVVVLENGLPRQTLSIDAFSRVGGLQTAAECGDGNWAGLADYGEKFMFQDAFALGQKLRQRLTRVRELADDAGIQNSDIWRTAAAGVAETREWAGGAMMIVTPVPPGSPVSSIPDAIYVDTRGFRPEEWGFTSYQEMYGRLVLVYGPPWVADCAARLRDDACPADFALFGGSRGS